MFGSLLERPLVATDAVARYPVLVSLFDKELDCCKRLYNKHIQTVEELGEQHLTESRMSEQSFCRASNQFALGINQHLDCEDEYCNV